MGAAGLVLQREHCCKLEGFLWLFHYGQMVQAPWAHIERITE